MKKIFITLILTLLVEAIAIIALIYSGAYNISTSNHDNALVNRALDTGMTRAVEYHAKGIQAPPLTSPAMVKEGGRLYGEMCVFCHGAPGVPPKEIGKGLWPDAPNLVKTVTDWTPAQLFWITKNGIKFSAMPAWGPTHSDEKIWALVAFMETLPNLAPAEYKQMQPKSSVEESHDTQEPAPIQGEPNKS